MEWNGKKRNPVGVCNRDGVTRIFLAESAELSCIPRFSQAGQGCWLSRTTIVCPERGNSHTSGTKENKKSRSEQAGFWRFRRERREKRERNKEREREGIKSGGHRCRVLAAAFCKSACRKSGMIAGWATAKRKEGKM